MAADAVVAEAGSVVLQQPLHLFPELGHLMRRMLVCGPLPCMGQVHSDPDAGEVWGCSPLIADISGDW